MTFNLPEEEVAKLIADGLAIPLRYFPNGHVKKGYALIENLDEPSPELWKDYFLKAVQEVIPDETI